ncbi:MAG: serine hydrolase [Planctomycetota bacterium]
MRLSLVGALLLGFLVYVARGQDLPRKPPASQGVDPANVLRFVERADTQIETMNSFMLVRHGAVVAEAWWAPYEAGDPHQLYSLSKSFTSIAAGIAIAEGKLSLDDRVVDWFPERLPPEPSDNLRAVRVRDLLRMTTGHVAGDLAGFRWQDDPTVADALACPVTHRPGTHFTYNTPASYTAAAVVEQATGQPLHDYLTPRLFEPLGIEGSWWAQTGDGVAMGGTGFNLRTEDIAKFGQLLLQRGRWDGRQLVPAAWIDQATSRQTSTGSDPGGDWSQGYGFQFWQSTDGYRGDGAFGQYCLVLPEQDAVVAITSGVREMGPTMRLVWDELLPGLHPEPLPPNPTAQAELASRLAGLTVRTPPGKARSPRAAAVSGQTYTLDDNPLHLRAIALTFDDERPELTFTNDEGAQRVPIGHGDWRRTRVDSIAGLTRTGNELVKPPSGTVAIAASDAWTDDDTYHVRLCLYETPFSIDLTCRFTNDTVEIATRQNVGFHAELEEPTRHGTLPSDAGNE